MRGGSLVVLIWALLLLALFLGNWLFAGESTQIAISAASVGVMVLWGVVGAVLGREMLRRGPPPHRHVAESVPDFSFAAALIGFSIASIAFGFAWGHFLTYFGLGLLVVSLVRLGIELRAERETLRRHSPPRLEESSGDGRPEHPQPLSGRPLEREQPPA